jgi:hypothetical protein
VLFKFSFMVIKILYFTVSVRDNSHPRFFYFNNYKTRSKDVIYVFLLLNDSKDTSQSLYFFDSAQNKVSENGQSKTTARTLME